MELTEEGGRYSFVWPRTRYSIKIRHISPCEHEEGDFQAVVIQQRVWKSHDLIGFEGYGDFILSPVSQPPLPSFTDEETGSKASAHPESLARTQFIKSDPWFSF